MLYHYITLLAHPENSSRPFFFKSNIIWEFMTKMFPPRIIPGVVL